MIAVYNEIPEKLLELYEEGFYCLPITRHIDGTIKHPDTYQDYKNHPDLIKLKRLTAEERDANGIAVVMGHNGIRCLDFDLKNTKDKKLFERWKANISPETLAKCYIEFTRNGGVHVFFFCKGFIHDANPAYSEEGRATIEFFCSPNKIVYTFPTPGYTEQNISLLDTGEVSHEEALNMLRFAELENRHKKKRESYTTGTNKKLAYPAGKENIFHDFDYRVDPDQIVSFLCKKTGWTHDYDQRRQEFQLWHPNASSTARSAVYFVKTNRMIVHSESQSLFPTWGSYDPANPTPYIITPTHILYQLADKDFEEVEKLVIQMLPVKIKFNIRRWLLTYVDKKYLKKTIHLLGQKRISGKSGYVIKVDSYLLVYLMHLIDPEYTWTCEGYADECFTPEECKSIVPENAIVSHAFEQTLFIDRNYKYPISWDL